MRYRNIHTHTIEGDIDLRRLSYESRNRCIGMVTGKNTHRWGRSAYMSGCTG
jgi:hypothetical protein